MKILHCCLAAFYIDNAGYQENILPKMHQLDGHQVEIVASTETYIDNKQLGYIDPGSYVNENGIPVTRLPYTRWLPHRIARKLRIYRGLTKKLNQIQPDIIFLHDCQFLDTRKIASYCRANPHVKLFVDGHADQINSARTWVSRNILHRIIYRYCAKTLEPLATRFFGVLPIRVKFIREMYGIAPEKTDLLVLGADDTLIDWDRQSEIRSEIRAELNVGTNDFLLVCGGKIDRRKNILNLLKAVSKLERSDIKLVLFGTPNADVEAEFEALRDHPNVLPIGWIPSTKVYDYFMASDLAIFPGTHSVLWEQAVGTGLPAVFRLWPGIEHVDLGGNCVFLQSGDVEEIKEVVLRLANDPEELAAMRQSATEKGIPHFSFREIARRAIEA